MSGRRYIVVLVLVWALILTWGVYLAFEGTRMARAEEEHYEDLVHRGMLTFAEHCVVCHGAMGQGVVGPPLNREEFRGHPEENRDVFDFIVQTVRDGRPGTTFPRWERLMTGEWASYTAMPTFGSVHGGPLNELYLRAVATFIMMGDWTQVGAHIPAPTIPEDREELLERLPNGTGLTEEESRQAKEIFVDRGCIACHTMNGVGGKVGPDLTQVGAWTQLTPVHEWEAFLREWITNPPAMENRAPKYWSNYSGPLPYAAAGAGAQRDASAVAERLPATGSPVERLPQDSAAEDARGVWMQIPIPEARPLGPTQMPALPMTDEERAALARWLARIGR
ncbi:MAG: c-type cytochrome [Firmicutes bacterium]|nr:c-type cytochrome [Bacillota bacterium]